MSETRIKQINVEGLHEQFDVHLGFKPGLNIIYGKNGRGKTTVLHILANALELDFKRFESLSFRRIVIETFAGAKLEIVKDSSNDKPRVFIDGAATSLFNDSMTLSEAETASMRNLFGERPTYLPAFRSVLERVRSETPYYRESAKDAEYNELETRELQALRETMSRRPDGDFIEPRGMLRDEAVTTIRKTVQCRQWFGPFVPVVRYPSILEVDDGLTTEWRVAQLETAQREQNMFADVFVKVFRTIVGLDKAEGSLKTEVLLAEIADSLNSKDYQLGNRGSDAIYEQLYEATEFLKKKSDRDTKGIETSVLQLYLQTLVTRKEERRNAFQRSRDFESSINKFLDKKTLRIGTSDSRARARSAVTVGTEGGRAYGLSALSSGEKQILTMLYSASRSRFKSGVFLIDEPELSLHIDWQRQILHELMAQSPDRQIIACTHSPEVGAEHLEETQDFEPAVTQIRAQNGLFGDDEETEE